MLVQFGIGHAVYIFLNLLTTRSKQVLTPVISLPITKLYKSSIAALLTCCDIFGRGSVASYTTQSVGNFTLWIYVNLKEIPSNACAIFYSVM